MASHAHDEPNHDRYFVPAPSAWPFALTFGLFLTIIGVWSWLEDKHLGPLPIYVGVAIALFIIVRWFRGVSLESEGGAYNAQVDRTYRWGMSWFIFSEVMFFGAFFGALFYMRVISVPDLGSLESQQLIWPGFKAAWPVSGPGIAETFSPM